MKPQAAIRISIAAFATIASVPAQSPPTGVKFEVASVRPVPNGPPIGNPSYNDYRAGKVSSFCMVCISGQRYDNYGTTLKAWISEAYRIDARSLVAPDWINQADDRFAIHAEMPEGSTRDQIHDMLRALLEERFHLVVHRATVEQNGYALVIGKNGPKLKEPGSINPEACDGWHPTPAEKDPSYQMCTKVQEDGDRTIRITMLANSARGPAVTSMSRGELLESHHEYFRITMPQLVAILTDQLSTGGANMRGAGNLIPVVNQTGLEGQWRVAWDSYPGNQALTLSSVNSALEKQGLRLEKTTAPAEKLFVDSMDKTPTEN